MIMKDKTFVHHYSPEDRTESGAIVRTIVFRQADDPYLRCKDEVDIIYDKVRRLLTTVETWLENSIDDDITTEVVQGLYVSINKTIAVVTRDVEETCLNSGMLLLSFRKLLRIFLSNISCSNSDEGVYFLICSLSYR